ncbi:MAG: cation transporter [Thermoguttaceae bacterium]|nr:cation transporter [Thermoguttaceae bacterium]
MNETERDKIRAARCITWIGLALNLLLSAVKFAAGHFGQSRVLVADAVHSLSDLVTDAAILIGSHYWGRPADQNHPYGHRKAEPLVALAISALLFLLAFHLIRDAAVTLYKIFEGKQIPTPGYSALLAALFSIVVKESLYRATMRVAHRVGSSAIAANAAHHRSDALSSIPALLSVGICIVFGPRWTFLDPVGTIIVGCLILYSVYEIAREPFRTLLDQGETEEILDKIERIAEQIPDIHRIHDIRTRPMGGGHFTADLRIHVDPAMPVLKAHALSHRLAAQITRQVYGIVDVVVHIEPDDMTPDGEIKV